MNKVSFWSVITKGLWKEEVMTEQEWKTWCKWSEKQALKDRLVWVYENTCIVNSGTKFAFTGVTRGGDSAPITYIADNLFWFQENLEIGEWIFYIRDCETGEIMHYIPVREKDRKSNPRIHYSFTPFGMNIKQARDYTKKYLNLHWELA